MGPLCGLHEHASPSVIRVTLPALSRGWAPVTGVKRLLIETPACDGHSLMPGLKVPLLVRFYHSFLPPLTHKVIRTGMNDIYSPCLTHFTKDLERIEGWAKVTAPTPPPFSVCEISVYSTSWLTTVTSDAIDFLNAKSRAREKPLPPG